MARLNGIGHMTLNVNASEIREYGSNMVYVVLLDSLLARRAEDKDCCEDWDFESLLTTLDDVPVKRFTDLSSERYLRAVSTLDTPADPKSILPERFLQAIFRLTCYLSGLKGDHEQDEGAFEGVYVTISFTNSHERLPLAPGTFSLYVSTIEVVRDAEKYTQALARRLNRYMTEYKPKPRS